MDDTLHLNSSKAVELEWLAGSPWVEFIFYVNPLRVIPELLNGTSHGFLVLHMHKLCFSPFGVDFQRNEPALYSFGIPKPPPHLPIL